MRAQRLQKPVHEGLCWSDVLQRFRVFRDAIGHGFLELGQFSHLFRQVGEDVCHGTARVAVFEGTEGVS
jgi:hypothetical protein